jgi:hypothetical protein
MQLAKSAKSGGRRKKFRKMHPVFALEPFSGTYRTEDDEAPR